MTCVLEAWNHAFRSLGGVVQSGYFTSVSMYHEESLTRSPTSVGKLIFGTTYTLRQQNKVNAQVKPLKLN